MKSISNIFKCLLTIISPMLNTKILYFVKFKRRLDFSQPKTLNEKILWLKFNTYWNNPLVRLCADKLSVRYYIKGCGLSNILNPLLGFYDNVNQIPWEKLPQKFAIKCNIGAGMNIIVHDKFTLDIPNTSKILIKWLKSKPYLPYSEMQYKNVHPYILIEEYLPGLVEKAAPIDYKVYCFNGVPHFIMACVGREKTGHPKYYFFNKNWELSRINRDSKSAPANFKLDKPICLEEMLSAASKLSSPFPFVRVDFYSVDNKLIFGELTFTPAGGMDQNMIQETDTLMGNLCKI